MALARYKDLCIDAVDGDLMSRFWGNALGLQPRPHRETVVALVGPTPEHGVWVNVVPETVSVKQRVHLDVNGRSVAEYEELGARVLPNWGPFDWTVLADPEGGELCVFERDSPPASRHAEIAPRWDEAYRLYELGVDAVDAATISAWWTEVLGATLHHNDREFSSVEDISGAPFESIVFIDVPEPKTVKNRIHWDVSVRDQAAIDGLVRLGASVLRRPDDEIDWTVLADPEGNEFCAFVTAKEDA